jgi:hypothetical protein
MQLPLCSNVFESIDLVNNVCVDSFGDGNCFDNIYNACPHIPNWVLVDDNVNNNSQKTRTYTILSYTEHYCGKYYR